MKFKNDLALKFKGIPTGPEYKRFLAKIKPGEVKNRTGKVPKKKGYSKQFYRKPRAGGKKRMFRKRKDNKVQ